GHSAGGTRRTVISVSSSRAAAGMRSSKWVPSAPSSTIVPPAAPIRRVTASSSSGGFGWLGASSPQLESISPSPIRSGTSKRSFIGAPRLEAKRRRARLLHDRRNSREIQAPPGRPRSPHEQAEDSVLLLPREAGERDVGLLGGLGPPLPEEAPEHVEHREPDDEVDDELLPAHDSPSARPTFVTRKLPIHARVVMYVKRKTAHLAPPASRFTTASVLMHCAASTKKTMSETPTSGVRSGLPSGQVAARSSSRRLASSSSVSPSEKTMPMVETKTSRAANEATRPTPSRQSKPSGSRAGSMAWAKRPAKLSRRTRADSSASSSASASSASAPDIVATTRSRSASKYASRA